MLKHRRLIMSLAVLFLLILVGGLVVYTDKKDEQQEQSLPVSSPKPTSQTTTDAPQTEVIAENLNVPWDLAFLPSGDILFTERGGNIKHFSLTSDKHIKVIGTIRNVRQVGESGLHGIAIHPGFTDNRYVYVYYTYAANGGNTQNRVSRFTYQNGKISDEKIIVDNIPGASNHDGGRIRFGPDGYLYITTGDAQEPSLAQDKNSLAGKILRITSEGDPAPGNPFGNLVYSYGHRNPQGITWDEKGNLWETEHGPSGDIASCCRDEANLIKPGQNYGWPVITGDQTASDMVTPATQSGNTETWAPASIAFLNGSLYFGGLRGQALYKAAISGENIIEVITNFPNQFGRIRAVTAGPDGLLYISTSNRDGRGNIRTGDDKIIRVNPEKL